MRGRIRSDDSVPRTARHDYWGVVLEAPDAVELARFYVAMLEWEVDDGDPSYVTVAPSEGVAYLAFQRSPEYVPPVWPAVEGSQQMMMHLDIEVSDLETAVEHAKELGATEAGFQPQEDVRVMLDPVGHPFCLYLGSGD